MTSVDQIAAEVSACRLCAARFGATETAHAPRPVAWLSDKAPILIAGQAPGARVQASGIPFDDPSGDRLRDWLGVDREVFYDRSKFAILPMAFCYLMFKLSMHWCLEFRTEQSVQHSIGQKRVDPKYRSVSGQCGLFV